MESFPFSLKYIILEMVEEEFVKSCLPVLEALREGFYSGNMFTYDISIILAIVMVHIQGILTTIFFPKFNYNNDLADQKQLLQRK